MSERHDPTKVMPEAFRVVFENERVRVIDVELRPGQEVPIHTHPDRVVIPLTEFTAKSVTRDGSVVDVQGIPGSAVWLKRVEHAEMNTGKTIERVIVVELKDGKAASPR